MNQKYYYKIDVSGRYGYSFMVVSNNELDETQVLNKALVHELFDDKKMQIMLLLMISLVIMTLKFSKIVLTK